MSWFDKLKYLVLGLISALGIGMGYLIVAFPAVPPADQELKISLTPERITRGRYLAHNVAGCASCHSPREMNTHGFMPTKGMELTGGFEISRHLENMPGRIVTPNLTRLQDHSDGELYREITSGVRKDGKPMFPMMPYLSYGKADREDIYSIIAYLRTLKPKGEVQVQTALSFPFNLIARTIPQPPSHQDRRVASASSVEQGKYLVNLAACLQCHSTTDQHMKPLPGMTGAGGNEFPMMDGDKRIMVRSANITSDQKTGIGSWTKKSFIQIIRDRGKADEEYVKVPFGEANTIMGYWEFAKLTDEDLGAIYDYLRTLPPVNHAVVRFEK